MARPKRSNIDTLCDLFADLSIDAQDGILLTLTAIHRQAVRHFERRRSEYVERTEDLIKERAEETPPLLADEDEVERARRLA